MSVLAEILEGVLVAHLILLICFVVGAALYPWTDWEREPEPATSLMARVVCTCALGMASIGFALFILGLLGLLSAPFIATSILLIIVVSTLAWRSAPTKPAYWRSRFSALLRCWDGPSIGLYLFMLVMSARAILPNIGVSDPIWYHLAYAQDWALAGRLVVDPYMVFPFYANGFLLLFTALFAFKGAAFVNFLVWTTGLLTALGVYATVCCAAQDADPLPLWKRAVALFVALAAATTTTFLDLSVLGYVDVQIGAFALLSITAVVLGFKAREPRWFVVAAVLAGFLVGMKGSFIALVPIYLIALWWTCKSASSGRRITLIVLATFAIAASPWYARNLILAGDPAPPVLNLMLYHHDGLMTKDEWDQIEADLDTSRSPRALATLPIRAYLDPASTDFREYGETTLVALIYVPTIVWLLMLAFRKRFAPTIALPIFVLSGFIAYYLVTSTLLRYTTLFYPLLGVCVGLLLIAAASRWPRLAAVAVLVAVLTALPSPGDDFLFKDYVESDVLRDFHYITHGFNEQGYLESQESGYREEQILANWMHEHGYSGNVYLMGAQLDYYFRRDGVISTGDYTGPAGYFRLLLAIDSKRAAEFLNDLDTRAVMMKPMNLLDAGVQHLLIQQLKQNGYRELAVPHSEWHLLVRPASANVSFK